MATGEEMSTLARLVETHFAMDAGFRAAVHDADSLVWVVTHYAVEELRGADAAVVEAAAALLEGQQRGRAALGYLPILNLLVRNSQVVTNAVERLRNDLTSGIVGSFSKET